MADKVSTLTEEDWAIFRANKKAAAKTGGEPRPFAPIKDEDGGEIVLINAASIQPEPVNWLWPNGLQLGVLNLLAGRSSGGKSTIALSWSAILTSGGQWPDGQVCEPARAIYWSGEDGVKDTLLPRFLAAGGDREQHVLRRGRAHRRTQTPVRSRDRHAQARTGDREARRRADDHARPDRAHGQGRRQPQER